MDNTQIKRSGKFIAVKVPEDSFDHWYHHKTGCIMWASKNQIMGFTGINHALSVGSENVINDDNFEIIGLISEMLMNIKEYDWDTVAMIGEIKTIWNGKLPPIKEWNQWLVIKTEGE